MALAASLNAETDEMDILTQLQLQEYEDHPYPAYKQEEEPLPTTDEGLIALVCKELNGHEGWSEVNQEEIKISDSSGHGGSKTYVIEAPESCTPNKVGLHVRSDDSYVIPRIMSGAYAFEGQNLGPKQLAFRENFWIDQWQGVGTAKDDTPESWKKIGQLLASVHMIPTEWWYEHKIQYLEMEPVASMFPDGSLAWVFMQRGGWFSHLPVLSENAKIEYATAITTDHPIAGRIVTTHGDFHPGNIIDLGEDYDHAGSYRFRCVDFEFT